MRSPLILALILLLVGLARAANPRAIVVNGTAMLAVRPLATWMGAKLAYEAKVRVVTLATAERAVLLQVGSKTLTREGTGSEMPVACAEYAGTIYAPMRQVADAFGMTLTADAKAKTLTLTAPEVAIPLLLDVLPATPADRAVAETLAGLTVGDHPLKAVVLWGQPKATRKRLDIPEATDYTFDILGKGATESATLDITVKHDAILIIHAKMDFTDADASVASAKLMKTGRGLCLGAGQFTRVDKLYGACHTDYGFFDEQGNPMPDESGDLMIGNYYLGDLTLITTFYAEGPTLSVMTLCKLGTPRAWVGWG